MDILIEVPRFQNVEEYCIFLYRIFSTSVCILTLPLMDRSQVESCQRLSSVHRELPSSLRPLSIRPSMSLHHYQPTLSLAPAHLFFEPQAEDTILHTPLPPKPSSTSSCLERLSSILSILQRFPPDLIIHYLATHLQVLISSWPSYTAAYQPRGASVALVRATPQLRPSRRCLSLVDEPSQQNGV